MTIYPPNLSDLVIACSPTEKDGIELIDVAIPFTMPRGTTLSMIEDESFGIIVTTIPRGKNLTSALKFDNRKIEFLEHETGLSSGIIHFTITEFNELKSGLLYKFLIAFADKGERISVLYSNPALIKILTTPKIEIENLVLPDEINTYNYLYRGKYLSSDLSESLYSSQMTIYDIDNNICAQTDIKLHNTTVDKVITENENYYYRSYEDFKFNKILLPGRIYSIEWNITTTNGLQLKSKRYLIQNENIVNNIYNILLEPEYEPEDSCVSLTLINNDDKTYDDYLCFGSYRVLKASSEDNFSNWIEIYNGNLYGAALNQHKYIFKDFNLTNGVTYQYALLRYNSYGKSTKLIYSRKIQTLFEYEFLTDGEKLLKLIFDAKLKGFRLNVLDKKVNTIGGQYPVFFRNKNTNYKEFSLSCIISYLSDNNNYFSNIYDDTASINLDYENIIKEKKFREEVFNWLNDGLTKILKLSHEGTYCVRLMNVALEPIETLGRMLYKCNFKAYEVEPDIKLLTSVKLGESLYNVLAKKHNTSTCLLSLKGSPAKTEHIFSCDLSTLLPEKANLNNFNFNAEEILVPYPYYYILSDSSINEEDIIWTLKIEKKGLQVEDFTITKAGLRIITNPTKIIAIKLVATGVTKAIAFDNKDNNTLFPISLIYTLEPLIHSNSTLDPFESIKSVIINSMNFETWDGNEKSTYVYNNLIGFKQLIFRRKNNSIVNSEANKISLLDDCYSLNNFIITNSLAFSDKYFHKIVIGKNIEVFAVFNTYDIVENKGG